MHYCCFEWVISMNLFLEDANIAGRVLDLNVTSRNKKDKGTRSDGGIPFHALEGYLPKLAQAGLKLLSQNKRVIQMPRKCSNVFLTRVVTPGVPWDADGLDSKESYWLVGIHSLQSTRGPYGIAALDVSTGEFLATELPTLIQAIAEIQRDFRLRRLILQKNLGALEEIQPL